jgi:hypothetical protein
MRLWAVTRTVTADKDAAWPSRSCLRVAGRAWTARSAAGVTGSLQALAKLKLKGRNSFRRWRAPFRDESDESVMIKSMVASATRNRTLCQNFGSHQMHSEVSAKSKFILNSQQAIEIYKMKPYAVPDSSTQMKIRGQSIPIAKTFGVSPKAIRDIWSVKTWARATEHLRVQKHADTHVCGDLRIGLGNTVRPNLS